MHLSVLLCIFFCCTISGVFIPKHLHCGTPTDVKDLTVFPHIVSNVLNKDGQLQYFNLTWNSPLPQLNATLYVDDELIGHSEELTKYFDEVNNSNSMDIIKSFNLTTLPYETSYVRLPECEAVLMRTTLPNGASIEQTWFVYYEDYTYEHAGKEHNITSGLGLSGYYVTNYPYEPNRTSPSCHFLFRFSNPVPASSQWDGELGQPPFTGKDGVYDLFIPLNRVGSITKKNGYPIVYALSYNGLEINPLMNEETKLRRMIRGAAFEITDNFEILSLDAFDSFIGPFTGVNDTLYLLSAFAYVAVVDAPLGEQDGSESSGAFRNDNSWIKRFVAITTSLGF